MSGKTSKTFIPFMQKLLDILECENLTELSRLTQIPRSTLDPYATGDRMPSYEHAKRLAKFSELPLEAILTGFEERRAG